MNTVFSLEDLSDSFWAAPPDLSTSAAEIMNRSQSEWAFERFLEEMSASANALSVAGNAIAPPSSLQSHPSISTTERAHDNDVVEIRKPADHDNHNHSSPSDPSTVAPVDSDEYRAFLKNKLDLACAAVALRASSVKPEDLGAQTENQQTQAAKPAVQSGSQAQGSSVIQSEPGASSISGPTLSATQKKHLVQARQATSGSSREDSDEDELEGDTETTENADPADVKRARRMLSNRESARRSRRRKQEHMSELETQVGQLRVEHSSLLKRLSDMNHKYDDAAVDNRILKADIETLRAKVKMAEETVKRVTGINPLFLARSNIPSVGMPFVSNPMDTSLVSAVAGQANPNQFLNQTVPSIAAGTIPHQRLDNSFTGSTLVAPIVNPQSDVASAAEQIQKQIGSSASGVQKHVCPGVNPAEAVAGWNSGLPHAVTKSNQKN